MFSPSLLCYDNRKFFHVRSLSTNSIRRLNMAGTIHNPNGIDRDHYQQRMQSSIYLSDRELHTSPFSNAVFKTQHSQGVVYSRKRITGIPVFFGYQISRMLLSSFRCSSAYNIFPSEKSSQVIKLLVRSLDIICLWLVLAFTRRIFLIPSIKHFTIRASCSYMCIGLSS